MSHQYTTMCVSPAWWFLSFVSSVISWSSKKGIHMLNVVLVTAILWLFMINSRRFFEVNNLSCINMDTVFHFLQWLQHNVILIYLFI